MTIAVLGNCQALAVKTCVEFLTGHQTSFIAHDIIHKAFAGGGDEAVRSLLARYDLILSQDFGGGSGGQASNATVQNAARRWVGIPNLHFTAFHPDAVYVFKADGSALQSPLSDYHSALTLFGYRSGLKEAETLSLFRHECFDKVGYYNHWATAERAFLQQSSAIGFPGAAALARWSREGVFLHTANHPKLFVVEDIARTVLAATGITTRAERCADYLHDGLLDQVWPVYPEVAARYGVPGSFMFRRATWASAPFDRLPSYMSLPAFIAASYATYRTYDDGLLRQPQVDRWLGDAAMREMSRPM